MGPRAAAPGLLTAVFVGLICVAAVACNKSEENAAAAARENAENGNGERSSTGAGNAAGAVDLGHGVTACEVEMSGRVGAIISGNRAIIVYTAIGDCMADDAQIIDRTEGLGDGEYFAEVFVPCGTKLSLCAAVEAKVNPEHKPLPTVRYGALGRELLAVGQGEIEFNNLSIALKDGPRKVFATPSRVMRRPAGRPVNPHRLRR